MKNFFNVLRGGRGEQGKEEMKRGNTLPMAYNWNHSQLLGPLRDTRESWLSYHWFTRQRHSLHCNTEPFVDHVGILRRKDGRNPQPWRTLQSKLAANQLLWDLPLGVPCFLCFPLSCGHISLWSPTFLFLDFLLFHLCLFVFLDFCALSIRSVCFSVTCSPGVGGKGMCVSSEREKHCRCWNCSDTCANLHSLTPVCFACPGLQAGGSQVVLMCIYKWLSSPTLILLTERLKQVKQTLVLSRLNCWRVSSVLEGLFAKQKVYKHKKH